MDGPLWIDTHAPALADLPQPELRDYLGRVIDEPINLILHGPPGAGKTAAARALARASHGDPENDLVEINVADFFGRTKSEILNDPRFEHFLAGRSRLSKRDMINRVLKETAGYPPVSGDYRTVLLDNAEAVREDFQQALRRVMERYHAATRFVIATRQPTKLIPPIRSRCVPVPVRAPTTDEIVGVLAPIAEAEEVPAEPDGLAFVAGYANGDLRRAVLGAQTVAATEGKITRQGAYDVLREIGDDDRIAEMLGRAAAGEFTDARSVLDDLLIEEGYEGDELLREVLRVARSRNLGLDLARLTQLAGEIDLDLATGTNDRIHLGHLLAEIGPA